ncbi:Hypothetical_protein [Hexamita inflata]|uniref:Hypothetical_protein n=1 Tax=Hexamita inflata TaxID=28002 RepID=A0AA86QM50_9EUKA|nr:Hypothetical protein HINF_LOCUS49761 [Hexamita inflata]
MELSFNATISRGQTESIPNMIYLKIIFDTDLNIEMSPGKILANINDNGQKDNNCTLSEFSTLLQDQQTYFQNSQLTIYVPQFQNFNESELNDQQCSQDVGNMLLLYSFLKMIRIHDFDSFLNLTIVDNDVSIQNRYFAYNQIYSKTVTIKISWMWCHTTLFMMHIGFKQQCIYQHNVLLTLYHDKVSQSKETELKKEANYLYLMAQGVSYVMNPFIQVLPIFELDLSQVETSDSNSTKRNEYDTYLNLGKNLIECKFSEIEPVLKKQIPPSIISLNPLLLPFQYTLLKSRNELCPIQYWVSLMVEQSHMFKVFNCVLNYIYHKAITSSITNSFSLMHEGSKTGKSTFILAILYAYLFHSQLKATPIVANNCPGSALQQLYYQNNLLLQDQIGSLNKKFIDYINNYQKYDLNNEMLISYIINSNLQDWSGYTHVVIKVAENIQKQLRSNTLLKYIISKKIDQTPFKTIEQFLIAQFRPQNTEETIEQFISNVQTIFYNETLSTLINTVSQFVEINRKGVNQDIDDKALKQLLNIDSHTIKQLFEQINYYLVNQTIKPIRGILLIDEICNTKIDVSQQNKADYQTLLLQLTKYLIINYKSKDFILLFKQSLQSVFKQTNNQYLLQFEQIINPLDKITSDDILRTLFLIFPLSMFLKENGVMNIMLEDNFKQMCMQQNWYQNDKQQIIKEQFTQFIELSNISGFEALAYRDILNAVVQINNDNKDGSYNIWKNNIQDQNLTTFMLKVAFQEKQNKLVYQEEILRDKLKKCQDLQLVQDQYSIVCAGTNAKLPEFINYCSNLLQTGGSRLQQHRNMYLYFVSLLVPQLHPSFTNKLYYIHGINSVKYSQIKPEYSLQYLVSDLFTIMQSDSTSFAQTICSAISPQLVIVQTDNKVFYPKSQVTYYKLALLKLSLFENNRVRTRHQNQIITRQSNQNVNFRGYFRGYEQFRYASGVPFTQQQCIK